MVCIYFYGDITFFRSDSDHILQVLFQAGVNGVATTIEQGILWACKYGHVQEQVYKDLVTQFGQDGDFSLKMIKKLHIFRAFIYEILRLSTLGIASIPRYVMDDNVKFAGYNIPKGYGIIGDYASQNKDKSKWKTIEGIDINNHLDINGKFVNKGNVFTFGIGRRNCPGQALAIKIVYCVMGNLMLNYKFKMLNTKDFDDIEGRYKGGPDPPQTPIRVIKR